MRPSRKAVADSIRKQVECGIDIVTDGEFSKPGFFTYIQERLEGFEPRPDQKLLLFQQEVAAFPEYYAQYFKEAMMGGAIVPIVPVVCTGPVKYRGEKYLQIDIDNLKAAAKAAGVPDHHVFLPATAPSGVGINEYYKSEEEYFHALAAELNKEYKAIVAAGILVQVDDPFLPDIFFEPGLDDAQKKRRAEIYVEATNAALDGIPSEMVRFHTCYGINEGPRLLRSRPGRHHRLHAQDQRRLLQLRGCQSAPRARISSVRADQDSGRQGALPRHDHACQQHRRASGADRRAHHALRQAGRPRERDRGGGLRLLVPGAVQDRGAPHRGLGEVQGAAAGCRSRDQAALGHARCMTATPSVGREALRRKSAPLLLCERARTTPDQVALRSKRLGLYRERSWGDYAALVARAARGLRALGLERGDRLAIMGDACEDWMICDLAAQSLGAIVYGIYPTASASEVEYQMRDGGAVIFVAENQEYVDKILAFADRLAGLEWIVVLDRSAMFAYEHPKLRSYDSLLPPAEPADLAWLEQRAAQLDPDAPAFIVYTSGTTGQPKGAVVTHGKHLAAAANLVDHYPALAHKQHRTVGYLPLCHVLGRDVAVTLPLISQLVPHFGEEPGRSSRDLVRDRAHRPGHRASLPAEIRLAGAARNPQLQRRQARRR